MTQAKLESSRELDLHVDVIMQDMENQLVEQRASLSFGDVLKKLPRYTSDIKAAINVIMRLKQLLKLEFTLNYKAALNLWTCTLAAESIVVSVQSKNPAEAVSQCAIKFYSEVSREGMLPQSKLQPNDIITEVPV